MNLSMIRIRFLALFAALVALAGAADQPRHTLYVVATINNNFVVGSKMVTLSGLFKKGADDTYAHFGLNFPYFVSMAVDPRDPKVLYVASINGVLCSTDAGATWRVGTSWDVTEPKDVFIDPSQPDHIYLALPDGIAVSTDRGRTWPRRENGLPERGKYTQTIKVDRTRAGRALAGCESGIYLTEDTAGSWRRVFAATATVTNLVQSPHDAKVWLATTQSDGALISRDGGVTWQKIPGVPSAEALYNASFDATNPKRLAIGSWTYGVLVSEDGGATWQERNAGLPAEHCVFRIGIDPDSGRLYAGVYRDAVFVSDDFGRTWRKDGLEGSLVYNFLFVPKAAK
jgi:photosystem II stability/assembly factor-like uncharacterized protein